MMSSGSRSISLSTLLTISRLGSMSIANASGTKSLCLNRALLVLKPTLKWSFLTRPLHMATLVILLKKPFLFAHSDCILIKSSTVSNGAAISSIHSSSNVSRTSQNILEDPRPSSRTCARTQPLLVLERNLPRSLKLSALKPQASSTTLLKKPVTFSTPSMITLSEISWLCSLRIILIVRDNLSGLVPSDAQCL